MKLICLNIWGGQVYEPLMEFIREQSATTDIFCFQEVFRSTRKDIDASNGSRIRILDELAAALPDFSCLFHPLIKGSDENGPVDFELEWGAAEFIKKSISITSSGELPIFAAGSKTFSGSFAFNPRAFGYFKINYRNLPLTVINVHGMTFGGDNKLDNPERLEQSLKLKEFALKENNPVVICGDFNILPEAESITMLEDKFTNLVRKFEIAGTRSNIHLRKWGADPIYHKFSDYAFVSPELEVIGFTVPDIEISDHLPLIVEFR